MSDVGDVRAARFRDQVAVVTGAGRGIGRAVARGLAREGARVVIAEIDERMATAVADEIREAGGEAHPIQGDVSQAVEVQTLFDEVAKIYGATDILVNNAGIVIGKPIGEVTDDDWERQIGVNLKGTFLCTQAAARQMIPQGRGKIVNFGSVSAFIASSGALYDTSKGGVRLLTISTAAELAPHGINVNAVAPGAILTDMSRRGLDTPEKVERVTSRIPMQRLGTVDDIVGPVLFLCSSESDYVTGHMLVVDGGRLAN